MLALWTIWIARDGALNPPAAERARCRNSSPPEQRQTRHALNRLRLELLRLNMCLSMFATLLVPLDGEPEAVAVLPLVRAVATPTRAKLVLVRAVNGQDEPVFAEAARTCRQSPGACGKPDLSVETTVLVGQPAIAIAHAARAHAADLIVMSTHGRGGVARAVVGSVTAGVLAHCRLAHACHAPPRASCRDDPNAACPA